MGRCRLFYPKETNIPPAKITAAAVRRRLTTELTRVAAGEVPAQRIADVQSNLRYSFQMRLETPTITTPCLICAYSFKYCGTKIRPCRSQATSQAPEK